MKILFQGDSITDAGRNHSKPQYLGNGYVSEIAMRLSKQGLSYDILNTANGGDRICDIYSRWEEDTLNHEFDILSILCGINDVGFGIRENKGISAEKYKFIYDRMLYEVTEKNKDAKLIIMEPFVFRKNLGDTNLYFRNDIYLNFDLWRNEVAERANAAKEIAEKYGAVFIPLAENFDEVLKTTSVDELTDDGIHPTVRGHKIIADEWIKYSL